MFNKTISCIFALSLIFGLSGCSQTGGISKINGRSISTGEIDKVVTELMESANVYDSRGEAYMLSGQTDRAIGDYEKSLELDPKNNNASEMLKKLRGNES